MQIVFVLEQKFQDGREAIFVRSVLRTADVTTLHHEKRCKKMAFRNSVGRNGIRQAGTQAGEKVAVNFVVWEMGKQQTAMSI